MKKFINGFRKINYIVPLQEECKITQDIIKEMSSTTELISKKLEKLPIKNVIFGFKEYKVKKVRCLGIRKELNSYHKPISFVKVSYQNMIQDKRREIRVVSTIYSMGLDDRIWRFDLNSFIVYSSSSNEFNDELIDYCIEYTNEFIKVCNLDKMCRDGLYVNKINEYDQSNTRNYEGQIKTFGNGKDFMKFGIDDIVPDININDIDTEEKLDYNQDVLELLDDESLVINVIRKKKWYNEVDI